MRITQLIDVVFIRPRKWQVVLVSLLMLIAVTIWTSIDSINSFRDLVKLLIENVEPLSILAAVIVYFKETPDRKIEKHYQAWSVIDAAHGIATSYARKKALQDLAGDKISMADIDLSIADLRKVELSKANLTNANLQRSNLAEATLNFTWLIRANLTNATLIEANLRGARLSGALLCRADFNGATLTDADLREADLQDTNFTPHNSFQITDLRGADFRFAKNFHANQLIGTRCSGAIMPNGSIHP